MGSGELFLIIVPFKNATFGHKHDIVRIEYLINDCHNQTTESNLSYLNDILRLHDTGKDQVAGNIDSFKTRNLEHRSFHHYVYDHIFLFKFRSLDLLKEEI